MRMSARFSLPISVLAGTAFLVAACDEVPSTPDGPLSAEAPPGACSPWPDCRDGGGGGDDDGGGSDGPFELAFPDDLAYASFGVATTGTGTIDLTGENTADGIIAEGAYSLVYEVDTTAGGICDAAEHPLVALFDGVELNSPDFSLRFDKEADSNGSFEINDRIRVDSNELQNPNGDDGYLYSVWFRGRPSDPDYDPATDVQYQETTDADGDTWTSIKVENEDVFVRQLECRNPRCNSKKVVAGDRCKLAADYSLKATR